MTNPIEAIFTISRDEYVRAIQRHYKTKLQVKRDLLGSIVAIAAGIYFTQSNANPVTSCLLVVAGGILLALVIYAIFILPGRMYRHQPKLKSEYHLEFRDDAMKFRTEEIDSELKWSIYHSWLRDQEFFILYHGERDISVIPRRALDNHADKGLAELLQKHVGPELVRR